MEKNNSKRRLLFFLIYIIIFLSSMLFCDTIVGYLIMFFVVYILFFIQTYKSLGSLKKMVMSFEFILATVFFVYAVPCSILYVMDGYKPRIQYFLIDDNSIYLTLKLYYSIFCIFLTLITMFGGIRSLDDYTNNRYQNIMYKNRFDIFDLFAFIIFIYIFYLYFRNGFSIFSIYFQDLRKMIQGNYGNFLGYLYIYMIAYSSNNIYKIINRDKSKRIMYKEVFVVVLLILFWGLSLLTDRRNFVNLGVMLILTYFYKLRKINIKVIVSTLTVIVLLLSISYFRSGTTKKDFNNVFFLSTGEFVLTQYVTNYYINYDYDLRYGKTYTIDVITSFIPRRIYKNKPILLSQEFKNQAKTNVGYAFNPVAEGIINFGYKGAMISTPIILLLYVKLAYYVSKKNFLYYIAACAESINFCRGIFSVSAFSLFLMIFITKFMFNKGDIINEQRVN